MKTKRVDKVGFKLILSLILVLLAAPARANGEQLFPQQSARPLQTDMGDDVIYLPLIPKNYPRLLTSFGVETLHLSDYVGKADEANVFWVRYGTFSWKDIEPVRNTPPAYIWDSVDETGLIEAAQNYQTIIAVIRYTPDWAVKYPGVYCGPIAQNSLNAFAQFMQALVLKYGKAPYNIKYWEIGNEIEVEVQPPEWSLADRGCWGEKDKPQYPYYGGEYYAEMLKRVYPAVKAVDPTAQILIGGLLLGCDPDYPLLPKDTCKSSNFLEGILSNQGAQYFDIVSFHSYAYFYNGAIHDTDFVNWVHKGGQVMGKVNFLRQVMAKYNTNKPLMLTEVALLCVPEYFPADCDPAGSDFFQAQADFVVSTYVRTWAADVKSTIWFTLENNGWRYSGLLEDINTPRPGYDAYKFMTTELQEAKYIGQTTSYPNVAAYKFSSPGKQIWVMWSTDNSQHNITLPINTDHVYDKYGGTITPVNGQIPVKSPVYLEIIP
jgi:hypothetical protein